MAPRVEPAHATGNRAGLMRQRARNRSAVGAYVATIAYAPLLQYRILFLRTNSRAHSCGPPRAAHNVGAPKAVPHPLRGCTHPLTNLARARRKSANIDSTLFPSHDARPLLLTHPRAPQLVGPYAPPLDVDACPSVCRSIGANAGLRDKRTHTRAAQRAAGYAETTERAADSSGSVATILRERGGRHAPRRASGAWA